MIDFIFWNYYSKGLHLVKFLTGAERKMNSTQISEEFSLGQLRRVN